MRTLAKIEFVGNFSFADDPTPEATDAEMEQVFGRGWDSTVTFGQMWAKAEELLKPFGQDYTPPQAGGVQAQRIITRGNHTLSLWTTTRQVVRYALTTEPPKPKG